MEFDPASLDVRARYKLLIGGIVPRPIALVSTVSPAGVANLAPFSFFTGVGSDPPMLAFCPANTADGHEKDTLRNAKPETEGGTGEFVVNVTPAAIARRVAAAAEPLPPDESEFDLTGLTPIASAVVKPPRVLESPVAYECVTRQVIRTNPGAAAAGNLVLGEIVRIHVDGSLVDERHRIDPAGLDAVGRMGGFSYCRTRDRFDLTPGRKALEESGG
jgi:flavin reductase (DIM6/NTAB) family NADH-FMN oxidoreductase RutF